MDSTLSARRALGARRESVVNKAEGIWTHQQPEGFTEWFLARATPPGSWLCRWSTQHRHQTANPEGCPGQDQVRGDRAQLLRTCSLRPRRHPSPTHHHHPDQIRRPGSDLVTKPASH